KSRTAGFSDVESRSWRVGGFYQRAADSFALELGYEKERAESKGENGLETETNFLSAGIRGPLLPTVNGSVRLGVQERELDRSELDRERAPFYAIGLDWNYSQLMSFNLNGERRFVTDSSDRSRDQTTLELRMSRNLGGPWEAKVGLRYRKNQFQEANASSATATVRGVFAGVDYALANWGTLRWTFELDEARSSEETFNYQAYRAGLELSARF
ncbi:MAG: outer membrane beta-barrel protein, partial [Verrucomicrobia bacterium]|nr:outer membrane beta-barrel protein [Verrucomicrobiota bacterium]